MRSDYCTTLDIAQTFFDLAGFKSQNGESLTPMLEKSYDAKRPELAFGNYYKYNGHSFEVPAYISYLPDHEKTFMFTLQENGYYTSVVGKQHFAESTIKKGYGENI